MLGIARCLCFLYFKDFYGTVKRADLHVLYRTTELVIRENRVNNVWNK